jgi:hypothetical protein
LLEEFSGLDRQRHRRETTIDIIGLSFKDNMSLSADGQELTSRVQITSDEGVSEMTLVFDRR